MRISRPCYDKRHRCPGWAGGGMKSAKVDLCDGGYVLHPSTRIPYEREYSMFEFGECNKCGVIVLPDVVRKFDLHWLSWHIPFLVRNRIEKLKWRWTDYKDSRL